MAPENWEMQPYHSVKSDVFQFGRVRGTATRPFVLRLPYCEVIWESCTYKFDEWFKYFTEGKGLLADPDTAECDPDQVTKSESDPNPNFNPDPDPSPNRNPNPNPSSNLDLPL